VQWDGGAAPLGVEHRDRYTIVRLRGAPTVGQFLSLIQLLETESQAWPGRLVLFDLRGIETLTAFTDQFAIGEAVTRHLSHLEAIASLVPQGRITGTSQKVARSSGVDLVVFAEEATAVAWLLGHP
jgi:hypothetical protein